MVTSVTREAWLNASRAAVLAAAVLAPSPAALADEPPRAAPSATTNPSARPSPPARPAAHSVGDASSQSTPRRALATFLRAASQGDFARAAECLDLRGLPRGKDKREGPELASMLHQVLTWNVALELDAIPDEPSPTVGPDGVVLFEAEVDGAAYTIALAPTKAPNGETMWRFSKASVAAIRPIFQSNERRWLEERVPETMKGPSLGGLRLWQWLGLGGLVGVAILVGRLVGALTMTLVARLASGVGATAHALSRAVDGPVRLALGLTLFAHASTWLLLPATIGAEVARVGAIGFVFALAWAAIALVRVGLSSWEARLPDDTDGDVEHRGLRTRLAMLRRIATAVIALLGFGAALMQFEVVRTVGVSLLASAGIAGVLVGFAAQRTLGGIIDGIAMSLTQPLRIGDTVQFPSVRELCTVEQIYFTYVVLRSWDNRRVIVPVTKVMAEPFENWTRAKDPLVATVDLWVDLEAPIEVLRARFKDACESSGLWDERTCSVLVSEMTESTLLLRGFFTIDRVSRLVDARAAVREHWVGSLRELEGGRFLPYRRVLSRSIDPRPS
jgi:small-conductance mechanosensitive channel